MAAPIASSTAIVPSTSWSGAPARTIPSPRPATMSPAAPIRGPSALRRGVLRRSPGGSACLLALVAVRIVVGVGAGHLLGLRVVKDDAEHACLRLLQLPLDSSLRRPVLVSGPDDVKHTVGQRCEQIRV